MSSTHNEPKPLRELSAEEINKLFTETRDDFNTFMQVVLQPLPPGDPFYNEFTRRTPDGEDEAKA